MSKIYTVPELQSVLSPIFRANGVRKATLFGSYAKGVATARSDVDLLVDSGLRGWGWIWPGTTCLSSLPRSSSPHSPLPDHQPPAAVAGTAAGLPPLEAVGLPPPPPPPLHRL